MAASLRWKIYTRENQYIASCRYLATAAALMAFLGDGATIRDGHTKRHTVYTEGISGNAAESYDYVVEYVLGR